MKRVITLKKKQLKNDDYYVKGSMAERIGYVWALTAEVCALGGKYDAQQRLQRHIVNIKRRKS